MRELMDLLLPEGGELEAIEIRLENGIIRVAVLSNQVDTDCPDCTVVTQRVHSRYERRVADVPWSVWQVCLDLEVRRFFCDNEACQRRTFTERLPAVVVPYGRRTNRLGQYQVKVGWETGGQQAVRVLNMLQMPTSRDTVLRLITDCPETEVETPRVLGVDDWAWCKGQRYGTILVDLEKGIPVDLLPDRSADSLTEWLQAHPEVEIITRDRAQVYIDGCSRGAPEATQVADRWHLLKNLKDTLKRLLDQHPGCLYAAAETAQPSEEPSLIEPASTSETKMTAKPLTQAEKNRQQTRAHRLARYQQVIELKEQGLSIREIARQTGYAHKTIRRYLKAGAFPEMAQRRKTASILDPYLPYLKQQWADGQRNSTQLFQAIQKQGYPGSNSLLRQWLAQQRQQEPKQANTAAPSSGSSAKKIRPWSANYAVWLMLKEPHELTEKQQQALSRLLQASDVVQQAYKFAQAFVRMVRYRFSRSLEPWLEAVIQHKVPALQGFAKSLSQDKEAVLAALSWPWSNGPVEGQVNRLKLIKRSMYGRANFPLLRRRVLTSPSSSSQTSTQDTLSSQPSILIPLPNIKVIHPTDPFLTGHTHQPILPPFISSTFPISNRSPALLTMAL